GGASSGGGYAGAARPSGNPTAATTSSERPRKRRSRGAWGGWADERVRDRMSRETLAETAAAAAQAGGEVALASWRNVPAEEISEKQKNDFVTRVDRESEERIVSRVRESFPGDAFLGEEGGRRDSSPGSRTWIIDPLDGTSNYISGFPFWSVSIAAKEGSRLVAGAVWDPMRQEMYTAERGAGAFRNGERIRVTGRPG